MTSTDLHHASLPGARRKLALCVALGLVVLGGCSTPKNDPGTQQEDTEGASGSESGAETSGSSADSGGADSTGGQPSACSSDADCDDGNVCDGIEICVDQACEPGTPPEVPTVCGDNHGCLDGECVPTTCGNGEIEPGEHCDDANLERFDGCDASCRYEVFYRSYEVTLMQSPAGSFCDRPNSALGDALDPLVLESDNATRKSEIETGVYNSIVQLVGLDDLSGMTDGTFDLYQAEAMPDPAAGPWPTDGSNPIDWPFLIQQFSLNEEGELGDIIEDVALTGGGFIGGPGTSSRPVPDFLDSSVRARFDYSTDPDTPSPPPDMLADGLVVPREIIGDGEDEGICGNLTVAFMANSPADPTVSMCLECPGTSHSYTPCDGDVVTDDCNSALDVFIGGCAVGPTCGSAFQAVYPTQPDVDHGGVKGLMNDPNQGNKVPASMTDGNLDGYSAYFRFRARRIHVTGTQ